MTTFPLETMVNHRKVITTKFGQGFRTTVLGGVNADKDVYHRDYEPDENVRLEAQMGHDEIVADVAMNPKNYLYEEARREERRHQRRR